MQDYILLNNVYVIYMFGPLGESIHHSPIYISYMLKVHCAIDISQQYNYYLYNERAIC